MTCDFQIATVVFLAPRFALVFPLLIFISQAAFRTLVELIFSFGIIVATVMVHVCSVK